MKSGFHFEKEGAGPHVVMNDRPAVIDDTNDIEVSEDELYDDQDDNNVNQDDNNDENMDDTDQTAEKMDTSNIRQFFRDSDDSD